MGYEEDGHTILDLEEELKELVRMWAMKKMATQFQTWKKSLYTKYVKKEPNAQFQY